MSDISDTPVIKSEYIEQNFEIIENVKIEFAECDPLEGVGTERQSPNFYRVNDDVFADSINSTLNEDDGQETNCNVGEDGEELTFIDNVVVQKRSGRRNRYHFDIGDESKPTCPQTNCNKTFSTSSLLKEHVRKVHCADLSRFVCATCGRAFKAKYLLARHTAHVHEMRKLFESIERQSPNSTMNDDDWQESNCNIGEDGEELTFIDNVIVQKRSGRRNRYHFETGDEPIPTCPQTNCNKTFATNLLLKAHVRKVHCADLSKYVCDTCGRAFKAKYLLTRHTAVHEMRKVQCSICHRLLSERTNLAAHMRTHYTSQPQREVRPRRTRTRRRPSEKILPV